MTLIFFVGLERTGTKGTEEYKKSASKDLTCDLKTVCCSAVIFGVTDIVPVLKSVARKWIGKTLQRNSYCLDLSPSND
jgi:hypothetical protein